MARATVGLALLCSVGCSSGGARNAATDASETHDARDAGLLSCNNTSAAKACASMTTFTCALTWSAAQTDQAFCLANSGTFGYVEYDCGGYHVLAKGGADFGTLLYYDETAGNLVAIEDEGNLIISCSGGPASGFAFPSQCPGAINPSPPPQCSEAGAPG